MAENPYANPSDPAKRHSAALTDGPDRAPARSKLRGTDLTDEAATSRTRTSSACRSPRGRHGRPEEVHSPENVACARAGVCGGQFTANTMSMAMEPLGIGPAGLNSIRALDPGKSQAAASSGSTSAVLHLLAIAAELGVGLAMGGAWRKSVSRPTRRRASW